jgi:hypothetical protein
VVTQTGVKGYWRVVVHYLLSATEWTDSLFSSPFSEATATLPWVHTKREECQNTDRQGQSQTLHLQ